MLAGPNTRAFTFAAAAILALAAASLALAQPAAVSSALGAPAKAKVAALPPADSTKPGEGPSSPQQAALMAAIAANDVAGIVHNGGTAAEAAMANHLLTRTGPGPVMGAEEQQAMEETYSRARFALADGQLSVAWPPAEPYGTGPSGAVRLGDLTLPGGNQDLPSIEEVAGPKEASRLPLLAPLPPGPVRTLPEIPAEWLAKK